MFFLFPLFFYLVQPGKNISPEAGFKGKLCHLIPLLIFVANILFFKRCFLVWLMGWQERGLESKVRDIFIHGCQQGWCIGCLLTILVELFSFVYLFSADIYRGRSIIIEPVRLSPWRLTLSGLIVVFPHDMIQIGFLGSSRARKID